MSLTDKPLLQQYPLSLSQFGTNLYGESIFRIVWGSSRSYLVGAEHTDYHFGEASKDAVIKAMKGKDPNVNRRQVEYRWLPLYPNRDNWVLERWIPAEVFTGMTRDQYDIFYKDPKTGLLTLGPYPDRGEYAHCFTFPKDAHLTTTNVGDIINRIRAGWNYNYEQKKAALDRQAEQEKLDRRNLVDDIMLDSQQAFKNRPSSVRPGKRTKDSIKMRYKAEDLRLKPGAFSTR